MSAAPQSAQVVAVDALVQGNPTNQPKQAILYPSSIHTIVVPDTAPPPPVRSVSDFDLQ